MIRIRAMSAATTLAVLAASSTARAANDPVKGEQQFGPCSACHTVTAGGANMTGPNLHGVFGKNAGTNHPEFAYSAPLKASGIVWSEEKINQWITDPAAMVPGTKMEFVGVTRADTRSNIIAYLKDATH